MRTTLAVRGGAALLLGCLIACSQNYPLASNTANVDAATSSIVVNPNTAIANGVSTVTVTATVRNVNGRPAVNVPLTFFVTGSDNMLTPPSGITDSNGNVTATLASTTAETKVISASVMAATGSVTLMDQETVLFTGEPASTAYSSMSVSPNNVTADNTVAVRVLVYNGKDQPVQGQAVTFTSSASGAIWTSNPNVTDATGLAQTTYHGTHAGNQNITASFAGVSLTASVTVTPGHANASTSTVVPAPAVLVGYGTPSVVTLTLVDSYNNPLNGNTVTWSVSPSTNNALNPTTGITDANGYATVTFTASAAQTATVTATVAGITAQGNITVHAPPTSSSCTLTANPNTAAADGNTAIGLTLHVGAGDNPNYPLANQNVVLSVFGRGVLTPTHGQTDANGTFAAKITSTYATTQTVQAVVDGVTLDTNVSFFPVACNGRLLLPGRPLVTTPLVNATLVASGDFNGDHSTDFALLGGNTVSIYEGRGNGDFNAPINTTLPHAATAVFVGTLYAGANVDLIVGDSAGGEILIGNPNGTFQTPMALNGVVNANQLAWVDVNQDGNKDILQLDGANGAVGVALGRGHGNFNNTISYSAGGASALSTSFATADFNGDTHVDIMVSNAGGANSGSLAFLAGDGTGTFAAPVAVSLNANGTAPSMLYMGDFNKDAIADLAVLEAGTHNVAILIGKGDGTFNTPDLYPGPSLHGPAGVAMEDYNNDGMLDFLVTDGVSEMGVYLGNNNGTFQPVPSVEVAAGAASSPLVVNLNGDIYSDALVAGGLAQGVTVLLGNGDGTFPSATVSGAPASTAYSLGLSDFNHDGTTDALVQADGALQVFTNNGNGVLDQGTFARTNSVYTQLLVADFNGDSNNDYAAVLNGGIVIGLSDGAESFAAEAAVATPSTVDFVQVGDINNDTMVDLVALGGGNVCVLLGAGNGTMGSATCTAMTGVGAPITPPAVVDLNNDHYPEVVLASSVDANVTVFMNSSGTLAAPAFYTMGSGASGQSAIAAGDFNGDHNQDIAVGLQGGGAVVALGGGDGTLQLKSTLAGIGAANINAVDLNSDGHMDVVVGGTRSDFFAGNGDGTFKGAVSYAAGQQSNGAQVADMNGDGRPDLVAVDVGEKQLEVLLSSGCN